MSKPHPVPDRGQWTCLSDERLLAQCEVDTYRASGPGGQKRNKTSSAVRLRHLPSGVICIAEESRSQHENKARALRRLRKTLFLEMRRKFAPADLQPAALAAHPDYALARGADGRLDLRAKDPRFWPAAAFVLDLLVAVEAKVSDAAQLLGISTANLVAFLETEPKLWQQANQIRAQFDQNPLRAR